MGSLNIIAFTSGTKRDRGYFSRITVNKARKAKFSLGRRQRLQMPSPWGRAGAGAGWTSQPRESPAVRVDSPLGSPLPSLCELRLHSPKGLFRRCQSTFLSSETEPRAPFPQEALPAYPPQPDHALCTPIRATVRRNVRCSPQAEPETGPESGCFARWGSRGAEGGAGESGAGQGAGEEGERVPKVTAMCTGASDALAGHLPGERAEGAGRFRLCWSQVALGDTGLPPRQHLGSGSGESQGVWEAPGADRKSAVGEERPGPREEGLTLGHFSIKKINSNYRDSLIGASVPASHGPFHPTTGEEGVSSPLR